MEIQGGCYCGAIRYISKREPLDSLQCHCRECQYITGGSPNVIMVFPEGGFEFTKGRPREFSRSDLERPVTRMFCNKCGTAIGTRSPNRPNAIIIKVGTFDDPTIFKPKSAIFTIDKQEFHHIAEGVIAFERRPK